MSNYGKFRLYKSATYFFLFSRYAKANMAKDGSSIHEVARMTAQDLSEFMSKEQKVEMAVEECEKLIEAFEPTLDRKALSMEGMLTQRQLGYNIKLAIKSTTLYLECRICLIFKI